MLQPAHTVAIEELAERADDIAAEIRAGHRLELIQGGKRIGEIIPCTPEPTQAEREAAWKEALNLMRSGIDLGGRAPTRDEMHER